jgi:hypothetical protein
VDDEFNDTVDVREDGTGTREAVLSWHDDDDHFNQTGGTWSLTWTEVSVRNYELDIDCEEAYLAIDGIVLGDTCSAVEEATGDALSFLGAECSLNEIGDDGYDDVLNCSGDGWGAKYVRKSLEPR